jgi:hypothetical protein
VRAVGGRPDPRRDAGEQPQGWRDGKRDALVDLTARPRCTIAKVSQAMKVGEAMPARLAQSLAGPNAGRPKS